MATNWGECERLETAARKLIPERHQHLNRAEVEFRFGQRDDSPTEGDYQKLGSVRKKAGEDAFHIRGDGSCDPLFLVSVPSWTLTNLDDPTFEAMVDHLLCFCDAARDDAGVVKISKKVEDFHGFRKNVEHYGLWDERFQTAYEAMKGAPQLKLDLAEPGRPALSVVGMGALEDGEEQIPPAYLRQCPEGHEWDTRRFGKWDCPTCGVEVRDAEQAAGQMPDADHAESDLTAATDAPDEAPVETHAEVPGGAAAEPLPDSTPPLQVLNGGTEPGETGSRRRGPSKRSLRNFQAGQAEGGDVSPNAALLASGGE